MPYVCEGQQRRGGKGSVRLVQQVALPTSRASAPRRGLVVVVAATWAQANGNLIFQSLPEAGHPPHHTALHGCATSFTGSL